MNIHVVVVDDEDLTRLGVQQSLAHEPHLVFLGGFESIAALCNSPDARRADVVLLDDTLPKTDLFSALQAAQECCPNAAVLILGSRLTPHEVQQALDAGARGVICKKEPVQDVLAVGIRRAHAGKTYISPGPALAFHQAETLSLTPRQDELLRLLARGSTVQDIAFRLGRSDQAVYSLRDRLRERLDVATNEQIVHEALRRGVLHEEDLAQDYDPDR